MESYKLKISYTALIIINIFLINQINCYVKLALGYLPNENYRFIQDNNQLESEEQIMKQLYFSKLITYFEIGTPSQSQMLFLDSERKDFYLDSYNPAHNAQEEYKLSKFYKFEGKDYYNESLSQSYIQGKSEYYYNLEIDEFTEYHSKDKLKLNLNGNMVFIEDFPIKIIKDHIESVPGLIGLSMNKTFPKEAQSFLYQLKSKNLIKDFYWFFDFDEFSPLNRKIKGELIIGDLPHNIFPQKYSKENYYQFTSCIYTTFWTISIDEIYIDNIDKDYQFINTDISLFYDFYPAIGPRHFLNSIKKNFLQELIDANKCFNGTFSQNIYFSIYSADDLIFYYCEKSVQNILYENLPSIKFIKNDFTFELNKEELFYIKGDYIYFMVLFLKDYHITENINHNYNFFVGQIFTSKYHFVFHTDTGRISYYKKVNIINEEDETNKNDNVEGKDNKKIWTFIVSTALVFVVIGIIIGIVIGIKFIKKRRAKRAEELVDEDYDYTPKNENNVVN